MTAVLLVAAGSAAGAVARYLVDLFVGTRLRGRLPIGLLVVNLTGSFALGVLVGSVAPAGLLALAAGAGFLGGYTTFSTFAVDTDRLRREGMAGWALLNVVASAVGTVAAAALGVLLASAW